MPGMLHRHFLVSAISDEALALYDRPTMAWPAVLSAMTRSEHDLSRPISAAAA